MAELLTAPAVSVNETYHKGPLPLEYSGIELCGDGIVLSALKAAEDGQGLILRAWESRGERVPACIKLSFADIEIRREFGPYEVCTFRIDGDTVTETDFVETKF